VSKILGLIFFFRQSLGAVWKSRWPYWAPRTVSVDVRFLWTYGFCGRKATLDHAHALITVWPYMSTLHPRTLSSTTSSSSSVFSQSSGAVWKLRWPSWAPRPNEPYGFCGRKATLNRAHVLVKVFFPNNYVNPTSGTLSSTSPSSSSSSVWCLTSTVWTLWHF